ncbi:MAG: hypothetical protein J7M25_14835, partial [Deltaproteobacteria bacterium]|nr:hypothetical protein [Deltaproteobacteria bacterium]
MKTSSRIRRDWVSMGSDRTRSDQDATTVRPEAFALKVLVSLVALLGVMGLGGGCASGASGSNCDPTKGTCTCDDVHSCPGGWSCGDGGVCVADQDASVVVDANQKNDGGQDGSLVDAGPGKGFGEPCSDDGECESLLCIFVGTEGFCSEKCIAGSCPAEYGCYGVLGAIEPGVVADVCIPQTNLLCSPCAKDSECSLIGVHLCLDYGGQKYCGRDCAVEDCPQGYSCDTVTVDGTDYKQCKPASGSCDCDASTQGNTRPCTITTPFGTCSGTMTCQGAQGWGICEPPAATDVPDDQFQDDNCDGIDGDINGGIFVATSGTDSGTCGVTYSTPCATINQGIARAASQGLSYVYIQAGSYDDVVVLQSGINLYGGYDSNWQRGDHTLSAHAVTVTGALDQQTGQYMAVRAHDLTAPTTVSDMMLVGPDSQGSLNGSALSSHVVHAKNASAFTLAHVTIQAGNGADGQSGANGQDAVHVSATSSMNGGVGGAAREYNTTCDDSGHGAGGAAGTNSCSGGSSPNAGHGGNGGTMDTDCGGWIPDLDAQPGDSGTNASQHGSGYGNAGAGGGTCDAGNNAANGRIQNGNGGVGGSGSFLVDDYWYASPGRAGGTGDNGGGGGGGGGSGGCDT